MVFDSSYIVWNAASYSSEEISSSLFPLPVGTRKNMLHRATLLKFLIRDAILVKSSKLYLVTVVFIWSGISSCTESHIALIVHPKLPFTPLKESWISLQEPSRLIAIIDTPDSLNFRMASLARRGVALGDTVVRSPLLTLKLIRS